MKLILGVILMIISFYGFKASFWMLGESGQDHSLWSYSPPFIVSSIVLFSSIYLVFKGYKSLAQNK